MPMSNTIPFLEMWFWSTTLYQKEGVLLFLYAKEAKTQVNKGFLAAIAAKKLTLRPFLREYMRYKVLTIHGLPDGLF